MAGPHGCTGTTRKGNPCGAHPLKGRDVCLAHADEKERVATGFGVNGGRPRKPREVDEIRERIKERFDDWYTVLDDARTATRAVVVGSGESASVEYVPDHAIRLAAFREVMDRGYGKPKQATEISGPDEGPIQVEGVDVSQLTDGELTQLRELLARARPVA